MTLSIIVALPGWATTPQIPKIQTWIYSNWWHKKIRFIINSKIHCVMAKPILIIGASIPIIFAALIAAPMILNPQVPFSAANADDKITIELIKYDLKKTSLGVTDRLAPQKSEILTVSDDGVVKYTLSMPDSAPLEKTLTIPKGNVTKLTALVKETGFMQLPIDSISADESQTEFTKFSLKVTLNGKTKNIQWPEQNATSVFIPPLVSNVESELERLIEYTIQN